MQLVVYYEVRDGKSEEVKQKFNILLESDGFLNKVIVFLSTNNI
jgi:hypothetical protein